MTVDGWEMEMAHRSYLDCQEGELTRRSRDSSLGSSFFAEVEALKVAKETSDHYLKTTADAKPSGDA